MYSGASNLRKPQPRNWTRTCSLFPAHLNPDTDVVACWYRFSLGRLLWTCKDLGTFKDLVGLVHFLRPEHKDQWPKYFGAIFHTWTNRSYPYTLGSHRGNLHASGNDLGQGHVEFDPPSSQNDCARILTGLNSSEPSMESATFDLASQLQSVAGGHPVCIQVAQAGDGPDTTALFRTSRPNVQLWIQDRGPILVCTTTNGANGPHVLTTPWDGLKSIGLDARTQTITIVSNTEWEPWRDDTRIGTGSTWTVTLGFDASMYAKATTALRSFDWPKRLLSVNCTPVPSRKFNPKGSLKGNQGSTFRTPLPRSSSSPEAMPPPQNPSARVKDQAKLRGQGTSSDALGAALNKAGTVNDWASNHLPLHNDGSVAEINLYTEASPSPDSVTEQDESDEDYIASPAMKAVASRSPAKQVSTRTTTTTKTQHSAVRSIAHVVPRSSDTKDVIQEIATATAATAVTPAKKRPRPRAAVPRGRGTGRPTISTTKAALVTPEIKTVGTPLSTFASGHKVILRSPQPSKMSKTSKTKSTTKSDFARAARPVRASVAQQLSSDPVSTQSPKSRNPPTHDQGSAADATVVPAIELFSTDTGGESMDLPGDGSANTERTQHASPASMRTTKQGARSSPTEDKGASQVSPIKRPAEDESPGRTRATRYARSVHRPMTQLFMDEIEPVGEQVDRVGSSDAATAETVAQQAVEQLPGKQVSNARVQGGPAIDHWSSDRTTTCNAVAVQTQTPLNSLAQLDPVASHIHPLQTGFQAATTRSIDGSNEHGAQLSPFRPLVTVGDRTSTTDIHPWTGQQAPARTEPVGTLSQHPQGYGLHGMRTGQDGNTGQGRTTQFPNVDRSLRFASQVSCSFHDEVNTYVQLFTDTCFGHRRSTPTWKTSLWHAKLVLNRY